MPGSAIVTSVLKVYRSPPLSPCTPVGPVGPPNAPVGPTGPVGPIPPIKLPLTVLPTGKSTIPEGNWNTLLDPGYVQNISLMPTLKLTILLLLLLDIMILLVICCVVKLNCP